MNKNILIVEDEIVSRKILEHMVRKWWNNVVAVPDWIEAIEKVKQQVFDIIFCDIHLPIMDWVEVINNIRKIQEDCNTEASLIIWITAGDPKHIDTSNFDLFIIKPLEYKIVTQIVA